MDFNKIIENKEYDFLRNEKELKDNIILLTIGGSHAYGTNIETKDHISDIDIRGIYLNSKEQLLLMDCNSKPYENRELDVVVYPLKQIIPLLTSCNPNTIELLGTKEEQLIKISKEGKLLRDNSELFLSKKVYASFGGYVIQQLRRLQNALARDTYSHEEKEEHIMQSIRKKMLTFKDRYKDFNNGSIELFIDNSLKENMDKEIMLNINLNNYPLRDFKNIYAEMSQVVKDYDNLNKRNCKKDQLHLLKHAMHLIRLLLMGTEILSGKGINTFRENDKKLLLDIRNGKYTYEEIFSMVDKFQGEFEYAYKNTNLTDKPNIEKINELVIEINKGVLSR